MSRRKNAILFDQKTGELTVSVSRQMVNKHGRVASLVRSKDGALKVLFADGTQAVYEGFASLPAEARVTIKFSGETYHLSVKELLAAAEHAPHLPIGDVLIVSGDRDDVAAYIGNPEALREGGFMLSAQQQGHTSSTYWSVFGAPEASGTGLGIIGGIAVLGGGIAALASKGAARDTTPPAAPTGLTLAQADDTGFSNTDRITATTSGLTITGQAEANARIELFDGGNSLGTAVADASGTFSLDVTLASGTHSITAKATDAAGNVSAASASLSITVDGTAPAAPTGLDLAAADDTGSSNSDNVTSQTSALTITGSAEANARVELFDGATSLGTATADAAGNFSLDVTLASGTHSITAKATDAAGNVSVLSSTLSLIVDTSTPSVPSIAALAATGDTTPTITGTAEANSTVKVYEGSTLLGTTTADGSGNWSFTPASALNNGTYSITATATDAAGNTSGASSAQSLTIGTELLIIPVAGPFTGNVTANVYGQNGESLGQAILQNDGSYKITVLGYTGPILVVVSDNDTAAEYIDEAAGSPKDLGAQILRAMDYMPLGNHTVSVTPLTELAARVAGVGPSNAVSNDQLIYNQTVGQLFGVEAITSVATTILDSSYNEINGVSAAERYGKVLAALSGADALTGGVGATLQRLQDAIVVSSDGELNLHHRAVELLDQATKIVENGPNHSASAWSAVNVQASLFVEISGGAKDGQIVPGGLIQPTFDTYQRVNVAIELLAAVQSGDEVTITWTWADGYEISRTHSVTDVEKSAGLAKVTFDANGLPGQASSFDISRTGVDVKVTARVSHDGAVVQSNVPLLIDIYLAQDYIPPAPEILSLDADIGAIGQVLDGGYCVDVTPTLRGRASAGSLVNIYDNGVMISSVIADGNGQWTYALSEALSVGSVHRWTASSTLAGVTSQRSDGYSVTIVGAGTDTTAPEAPSVNDLITEDSLPVITGSAEPGATVEVYHAGSLIGKTLANANGAWSFTPQYELSTGSYALTAFAIDAAGNQSAVSAASVLTISASTPPPTPSITRVYDNIGPNPGALSDGQVSNDQKLLISGQSALPGAIIRIFDTDALVLGEAVANADGTWSFQTPALADGSAHVFTARVVNALGVLSAASSEYHVTIDTTAPATPTVTALTTNDPTPVVSGTAEAGSTVEVTVGGATYTVTANGSGQWSVDTRTATPASGTFSLGADGAKTVSVTSTDAAGNSSSGNGSLTLDTVAPTVPVISAVTDDVGSLTGALSSGARTDDPSLVITGTCEAGSTVKVYDGSTLLGAATVTGTSWTYTASVVDGQSYAFNVQAVDAAGNASAASTAFNVTGDMTGPSAAPAIVLGSGVGLAPTAGTTSAEALAGTGVATVTGEVGALITVTLSDGTNTVTKTVTGNGATPVPVVLTAADLGGASGLADGTITVSATQTDTAGNVQSVAASAASFTLDTTAPATPTVTALTTNDPTPVVSGTAEAGSTVEVTVGGATYTVTANGSGQWSVDTRTATPASGTFSLGADGAKTVSVTSTDAAGNSSSGNGSLTLDTVAPTVPVLALGVGVSDVANFSETTAGSGVVTVTGEAGATITVTFTDGTHTVTKTVTGNGSTPVPVVLNSSDLGGASGMVDGTITVSATQTDAAGNVQSVAPSSTSFTLDTTAPTAPTGLALASVDDTGRSGGDQITSQTSALTISGQAEANALVELFDGATSLGTVTANGSGVFSLDVTLAAGTRTITAKAIDAAGNYSQASAALTVVVDTTAPTAPTTLALAAADDTGSINSDRITSQTSGLTLTGQSEANALVELFDGATSLGTVTADGAGAFSFDTALAEGSHTITAKATDLAGNTGTASAALTVVVDTTPPAAPTALDLATADDTGTSTTDDLTKQTSSLTISGQAEANAVVELFDGATSLGTVSANGSGVFTKDLTLAEGTHTITARAADLAGNTGTASSALTVVVDTTPPAAPTALDLAAADDTGVSSSDNITNLTSGLTISGQSEANAVIELFDGATSLGTVTADGSGAFSLDVSLAAGTHSLTAKALDYAGNYSVASSALSVVVDTAAPTTAPTGLDLATADDSGFNAGDNLTKQTTGLTISGSGAGANSPVALYEGSTLLGTGTANASGAFSVDISLLTDGVHNITAKVWDEAGNAGPSSTALAITIDTTAPAQGTGITAYSDQSGTVTSSSTTAPVTDDQRPGLLLASGLGSPQLYLYINGVRQAQADYNSSTGRLRPWTALAEGNYTFYYTFYDSAGNESPPSQSFSLRIDTTAPTTAPVLALGAGVSDVANREESMAFTGVLTVTGEQYATITVTFTDSGSPARVVTKQVTGNGSTPVPLVLSAADLGGASGLRDGAITVSATQTDGAGRVQTVAASTTSFTLDATAPALAITSQQATAISNPVISGTSQAGASVSVTVDGQTYSTTADAQGVWSVTATLASPTSGAVYSVASTATDSAGNATPLSFNLTYDNTAPTTAPVLALGAGVSDVANFAETTAGSGVVTVLGEAGATITVTFTDSGSPARVVTKQVTGNGSTPVPVVLNSSDLGGASGLFDGLITVSATQTDAAGNVQSVAPSSTSFTLDTTPLAAPTGLALASVDDTGRSGGDQITSQTSALTISGQAEANASVELFDGATSLGTVTANGSGVFSLDVSLAAGTRTITAKAIDAAGNYSQASAALTVVVDTTAPTAPTTLALAAADDTGSSNSDRITSQTSGLTLTGQSEANALVELFDGATSLGTVTADGAGAFSFDTTLAEGSHTITAKATDLAGNTGTASAALTVVVDTTPPAAPTALDLATADDTGTSTTDNLTKQTSALTISGQAEANAVVELFDGATSLGTVSANGSGVFTKDLTLTEGSHTITARAADLAGNTGTASSALTVVVDTTPPAAPTALDLAAADDTGVSNSDNITNLTSGLTISGQSEANAVIELFDGATSLGTVTADGSGVFSLDVSLAAGTHSLTAKALDYAGNYSVASSALSVVVDTAAPGFADPLLYAETATIAGPGQGYVQPGNKIIVDVTANEATKFKTSNGAELQYNASATGWDDRFYYLDNGNPEYLTQAQLPYVVLAATTSTNGTNVPTSISDGGKAYLLSFDGTKLKFGYTVQQSDFIWGSVLASNVINTPGGLLSYTDLAGNAGVLPSWNWSYGSSPVAITPYLARYSPIDKEQDGMSGDFMGPKALYVDNSAPGDTVNAANFYWGTADKVGTYTAVITIEASGNSTVDVNDAAYGVVNATTYYTTQPSVFTPDSLSVGTGLSLNLMYALGGVTNTTLGLTGNVRLVSSSYHYGMVLRVKDANGTVVQTSTADFDTAYSGGGYPYTYSSGARVTIAVEESFGINFNSLAQGAYTVEAAFSDRAGNLGSFTQVKAFEWDGTPADITVTDATSYRDDASDVIGLTLTPSMLASKVGTSQTLSLYYVRTDQYTAGTAAKDIVAALSGKPVDTWKSETVAVTSNNPVSLQKTPTDLASLSNGSYAVIVKDEAGVYKMASQTIAIHPTRIANTLDSYVVFDDPSNTVTVRLKTYGGVTLGSGAAATAINLIDQAGNTWVANYAGNDAQGLLYSFTLPTGNEAISSLQMAAGQSLTFSDITIGGSVPSITTAASSLPGTNINVPTTVVEQSLNTANFSITNPLAGATYEYWDYSSANASKWTAIPSANLSAFVPLGKASEISPNLFSTNYSTTKQAGRPLNADVTGATDLSTMGVITAGSNNNSDNKMLYSVVKTATGNATNDGEALAGFAIYRVAADLKIVYRKDGDTTSTISTIAGAFSNGIAMNDVYTVGFSLGAVSGSNRELKVFVGGDITSGLTSAAYDSKLLPSEFPLREFTLTIPLAALELTNTGTSGLNKWTVYDGLTYRDLTNQLIEMMGGNVTATGAAEGGSSNFNSPLSLGSGTFSTPGWQSDALISSYASTTPLFYSPVYTAANQPLQIRVTDVYGNIRITSVPLASFTAGNQFTVVAGDFMSSPDIALSQIALEHSTTDVTSAADYASDDLFLVTAMDGNGDAVDYLDEATGQMLDMAINLRGFASAAELDGGTHVTVSPLTELAVRLATGSSGLMAQQTAKEAVLKVQNFFHVDDLNGDVMTVTSSDYNEADGISSAEHMGQILALLSGGDTVMGSMDAALAQLEAILNGQVTPENVSVIFGQWSHAFEAGPNGHLADLSGLVESLSALHDRASAPTMADIQNADIYRFDPVAFQQLTWQSGGSDLSATSIDSIAGTAGSNDLTLQMVLDREDGPGTVLGDHVKVDADGELVCDFQEHGGAGQLMTDLTLAIDLSQVSVGNRADGQVVLSLQYEHYGNSTTPVVMNMSDHWIYQFG